VEKVWKKAELGMQVNIGDSVRTARRSKADIILDKDKQQAISIEELTLVVLNSTSPGQINRIDLSQGKIYADVEQMMAGAGFEVTTPSAVAGVSGTKLSVASNSKRDEIAAYKDSISVKTFDANRNLISDVMVTEGFKAVVGRFEAAGALTKLIGGEMRNGNRIMERLSDHMRGGSADKLQGADEKAGLIKGLSEETKKQIEERKTEEILETREKCHEHEEEPWW
jgi:hypothetical protein